MTQIVNFVSNSKQKLKLKLKIILLNKLGVEWVEFDELKYLASNAYLIDFIFCSFSVPGLHDFVMNETEKASIQAQINYFHWYEIVWKVLNIIQISHSTWNEI